MPYFSNKCNIENYLCLEPLHKPNISNDFVKHLVATWKTYTLNVTQLNTVWVKCDIKKLRSIENMLSKGHVFLNRLFHDNIAWCVIHVTGIYFALKLFHVALVLKYEKLIMSCTFQEMMSKKVFPILSL